MRRSPIDTAEDSERASPISTNSPGSSSVSTKRPRSSDSGLRSAREPSFTNQFSRECTLSNMSSEERFEYIRGALQESMEAGSVWYIVAMEWWRLIAAHATPGPVDNSSIATEDGTLKPDLVIGEDIEVVPEKIWHALDHWYGIADGTPIFSRNVINTSKFARELVVEIYPPTFSLFSLPRSDATFRPINIQNPPPSITLSRSAEWGLLERSVRQELDILPKNRKIRFWRLEKPLELPQFRLDFKTFFELESNGSLELLEGKVNNILHEGGLNNPCDLIVEEHESEGWSSEKQKAKLQRLLDSDEHRDSENPSSYLTVPKPIKQNRQGIIGLSNLGNTCYMNSALQCVSHIRELTEYFTSGAFRDELNPDNPLAKDGKVALAYANLLQKLFAANAASSSIAPRDFKSIIGRYGPSFSGYGQQDSQEFLAFLLDGLHEDLNRVRKKPYIEKPDSTDQMVDDVDAQARMADACWQQHRLRNDSCIQDLFGGMYKSTLVCPQCHKVSITFDPFYDLTLPLPIKSLWKHKVHFIPLHGSKWSLNLEMERNTSIATLKSYVAQKMGIDDVKRVFISEPYKHKFWKHHADYLTVSQEITNGDDVIIYELDRAPNTDVWLIPVFSTKELTSKYGREGEAFGLPFFITLDASEATSYSTIYSKVAERYTSFTTSTDLQVRNVETESLEDGLVEVSTQNHNIQEVFSMKILPSSASRQSSNEGQVPTGFTGVDHSNHYLLSSRMSTTMAPPPSMEDEEMTTWQDTNDNHHSPDMQDASSDEDLPYIQTWKNENRQSPRQAMPGSYDNSDDAVVMENAPREQTASKAENLDELVRRGEGIVCYWSPEGFESVFEGTEDDDLRGRSIFDEFEPFEDEKMRKVREQNRKNAEKSVNLDDCLDEFAKEETLSQEDLWYCPRCKEHRTATKTFELWKVPDIFVVHFKRFASSRNFRDKISDLIEFPIEGLDMSNRIGERKVRSQDHGAVYDLFAVDNHYGGLGGGHYTAYAKNFEDGNWYYFDDSSVRPTDPKKAVTPAAYLLFYRRRADTLLGGVTVEKTRLAEGDESSEKSRSRSSSPHRMNTRSQQRIAATSGSSSSLDALSGPLVPSNGHSSFVELRGSATQPLPTIAFGFSPRPQLENGDEVEDISESMDESEAPVREIKLDDDDDEDEDEN